MSEAVDVFSNWLTEAVEVWQQKYSEAVVGVIIDCQKP